MLPRAITLDASEPLDVPRLRALRSSEARFEQVAMMDARSVSMAKEESNA